MTRKFAAALGAAIAALILLMCALFASAQNQPGVYLVTLEQGVRLYESAETALEYKTIARSGSYLTVIRVSNGYGYTVYDSVYGWVELSAGVEYVSSMPSITGGKIEGAKGIAVTALPEKTVYVQGEERADVTGLEVSLIFDDGLDSMMRVSGYTVSFPDLDTLGERTVDVYYGGYSAQFTVEVVRVPVTGIVLTLPEKTSFKSGEAISFDGLTVTAFYSDGRDGGAGIVLDSGEYTISGAAQGDTTLSPGTHEITVTYKYPDISASFIIFVSERSVASLRLTKLPASPTIYQGQSFNTDDFALTAVYDSGESEQIGEFNIEYDNMTLGTHTARIYYMDKYVAFDYTVLELIATGIAADANVSVGSYVGSPVSFDALRLYTIYNSGERKLIESGYTLSHEIDIYTPGEYTVTAEYGGFTCSFEYTVAVRSETVLGDVNEDGEITAADARLALRAAAKLETLTPSAFLAADINYDNQVTASDARRILRYSARLEESLV